MQDEAFLAAMRAAPDDDGVRLVYADWLEEQGDLRAEFLRIEVALAGAGTDERAQGLASLRDLGARIDPNWLMQVSRIALENCGVAFQFQCPKRWELLQPTADAAVRFCAACRREVYFCATLAIAQTHAGLGDCIAVDPRLTRRPDDLASNLWDTELTMGLPSSEDLAPERD